MNTKEYNSLLISLFGEDIMVDNKLNQYSNGLQAYESYCFDEAVSIFSDLIDKYPEHQFFTSRGTAYEDMGDDIRAKADFEQAVLLNPSSSVALYRLGMVHWRSNDIKKAIECLKKSYEQSPSYETHIMGGGYNTILFVHKRVIAANLGMFLIQDNKHEEGCYYLDEVIANCPDYAFPYYGKGLSLAERGMVTEAINYLKEAKDLGYLQADVALKTIVSKHLSSADLSVKDSLNDECAELVKTAFYNPFNISIKFEDNQNLRFGDMTAIFRKDIQQLEDNYGETVNENRLQVIVDNYIVHLVKSYYQNAGIVPKVILDAILTQVYNATLSTTKGYFFSGNDLKQFMSRQYFLLTH
jgi:tetratricopeptide (TPR) repeat protein